MTEYRVKHALVSYGPNGSEVAFRGELVDLDPEDGHTKRLVELGALVGADEDLPRFGIMSVLGTSPSDAQLVNWVTAATPAEVIDLIHDRPELASRIEDAWAVVADNHERQKEAVADALVAARAADLGPRTAEDSMAADVTEERLSTRPFQASAGDPAPVVDAPEPEVSPPPALANEPGAVRNAIEELVHRNADTVAAHVAGHPNEARLVLEAEQRRAEAAGKAPRKTVVDACEAAIALGGDEGGESDLLDPIETPDVEPDQPTSHN